MVSMACVTARFFSSLATLGFISSSQLFSASDVRLN